VLPDVPLQRQYADTGTIRIRRAGHQPRAA
jgi:hypothetical protein